MKPTRKETLVRGDQAGTLLDYVARQENLSLRKAKGLLDTRTVFVNGRRVWMAKHPLKRGDRVEVHSVPTQRPPKGPLPLPVLFSSNRYWVINKPPGLLSVGTQSAELFIRKQIGVARIRAIHRLDKETSGALCFARDDNAFANAVNWFKKGTLLKVYEAIVLGVPKQRTGKIRASIDHLPAQTDWKVLNTKRGISHLRLLIHTGRTHQIRKHLAGAGYPILGDRHYFSGRIDDPRIRSIPRQMLHASVFKAPLGDTDKFVRVEAPIPDDFRQCLKLFGLK